MKYNLKNKIKIILIIPALVFISTVYTKAEIRLSPLNQVINIDSREMANTYVEIENTGTELMNIKVYPELWTAVNNKKKNSLIIDAHPSEFSIGPGEKKKVEVLVRVPLDLKRKVYATQIFFGYKKSEYSGAVDIGIRKAALIYWKILAGK